MALSDREILIEMERKRLIIVPFTKLKITPAGYDLSSQSEVELKPKEQRLLTTLESVELCDDILATIHLKSSLCREGLIGSFAVVDPGFRGKLTLSLFNAGLASVHIDKEEPIIQMIFYRTGEPSINPYKGKYQDSSGVVESRRKIGR
jgi:dCTP deaminase